MSWEDLQLKFKAMVAPALGEAASDELYETAKSFEYPGSLKRIADLLTRQTV